MKHIKRSHNNTTLTSCIGWLFDTPIGHDKANNDHFELIPLFD